MVAMAKEKLGGVDILVNNAGQMYSGRFAAIDDDEMQDAARHQAVRLHARDPRASIR